MPSPRDLLVTAALARLAVREQPKGSNRSPEIDAWLTAVGSDVGQAWCAAFVHAMGREVVGDQWAFRRSARVQDVVDAAVKRLRTASILHAEKGDLAVFFFPTLKRYAHIGIIVETPKDGVLVTVDGNTIADTAGDSREGWGVFVKRRKVNVDRMLALTWPEGA